MSVLIKGMSLPNRCVECPFAKATARLHCNSCALPLDHRPEWCPLSGMGGIRSKLHEEYLYTRDAFRHAVKIKDQFGVAWNAAMSFGIENAMNVINKLEDGDNG